MNQRFLLKLRFPARVRTVVVSSLLLLTAIEIPAQKVCDLSYCIQTGLEQNFSLQVIRNQEEIASNNYTWGNAGIGPSISSQNGYGGSLNTINQNYGEADESIQKNMHSTYGTAGINLEMPIFRGFQVRKNYQRLGMLSELEGLQTQMAVENLVAQIVSEYTNYVQQLIQYDNLAYAVSLSRERVRIDKQRYLLGSASKLELLQSIVYLNADSSRYSRQTEVLRAAQIRLNQLMSSRNLGEIIIPKDTLIPINEKLVYDELLAQTIEYNTSIGIARKNQVISELDYQIIKSRSYPYLKISSGYGYTFNNYGSGELSNQHLRGMNYELSLGIELYDGLKQNRDKQNARIRIENGSIRCDEVELDIKAELLSIYYAYENNLRLLRLEEQNLEVARENLQIALERYKLGNLSGLELREVQKSLLDAEERLISVRYQTKLAEISLLQISGKIMDYL
ncbi:MAG: TolC family protein [Bacteroidales bacterium]|nr:TolC family protein [Bacteroidales bacterium]